MTHTLYVYGTLRPGDAGTIQIPGKLYDLGWFPGIILEPAGGLGDSFVTCEKIEVEDLDAVDAYEGYNPKFTIESLYIRRPILDGWIYEYNQGFNSQRLVACGDWLIYTQQERGQNGGRFR